SAGSNDEQKEVLPEVSRREDKKKIVASESIAKQLVAVGLPENPPVELPDLLAEATEIRQEMAELQQPYSVLNSKEKKAPT
ncbi:MAG: hypothetical protein GWO23_02910, partial [Gammaproteobacteria bacterium]|nr:hypothetical protein [Gammaproteobacteria bacterium]